MSLYFPLKPKFVTQGFNGNDNNYYRSKGLVGHTGIDAVTFYDDLIYSAERGYVYKIINKDNPDFSMFRALFQIVETNGKVYELCYGHCHNFLVEKGWVEAGVPIATEGNYGQVWTGGTLVSEEEKQAGSKSGTHLHFQVREVQRVIYRVPEGHFLSAESGEDYKDDQGNYYLIPNYSDGFNGCIDPEPLFNGFFAKDAQTVLGILKAQVDLLSKVIELIKLARK